MYIRCSGEGGVEEGQGIGKREREWGRVVGTVIVMIILLKLTSRSIFDNRENGLSYFTYVVSVICV